MSFLGSIVNSIGGGRAPPPPQRPLNRAEPSNSSRPLINGAKITSRPSTNNLPPISAGLKRKAEDDGSQGSAKTSRSTTPSTTIPPRGSLSLSGKQLLQKPAVSSSAFKSTPTGLQTSNRLGTNPTAASKPPQRGSYAEMMARAKQSAEQHAQSQVGTIKHQETKKEKMSRLAEKRKTGHDRSKQLKPAVTLKKEDRAVNRVMEAGFDDMEGEEEYALKAAKEDDARELAYENQLKREKEERRKKLLGLAKKQK
ncbi:hypothetical protein DV736_g3740, partial [Chaetothyriales sp. CBS 134916]